MGKQEIINLALQLKATERIMRSLDKSAPEIDHEWAQEALHRAQACDARRRRLLHLKRSLSAKAPLLFPVELEDVRRYVMNLKNSDASAD